MTTTLRQHLVAMLGRGIHHELSLAELAAVVPLPLPDHVRQSTVQLHQRRAGHLVAACRRIVSQTMTTEGDQQ